MYYRKFCRRINFTNSQQRKKLKKRTILIRNSAKIIKSKEGVKNTDDTEGLYPAFFKQELSFLHGVCILRCSESTSVNR